MCAWCGHQSVCRAVRVVCVHCVRQKQCVHCGCEMLSCLCMCIVCCYLVGAISKVDSYFHLEKVLVVPLAQHRVPDLRHHPVVEPLLPFLPFVVVDHYLNTSQTNQRECAGAGVRWRATVSSTLCRCMKALAATIDS